MYYIEVHTCLGDWSVAHRYSSLLAMHDYVSVLESSTNYCPSNGFGLKITTVTRNLRSLVLSYI